jgi:broad specificity phosphatase PhoE
MSSFSHMNKLIDHDNKGKVLLVRHGTTGFNGADSVERIRGWLNVPLTPEGQKEAQETANKVAKLDPIDMIISSDLERAVDTANAIGQKTGVRVDISSLLRPWNLGDVQGKPAKDMIPYMNALIKSNEAPANGEPFKHFLLRYLPILAKAMLAANAGYVVTLVTHYRNIKAAEAWIAAGMPKTFDINLEVMNRQDIQPGGIVEIYPDGTTKQ